MERGISHKGAARLNEKLASSGLRLTPQRAKVYSVLVQERDHPTAEQVFIRAKQVMPEISLATVYNCLEALVRCGVVREVTVDRGATRFCPNMEDHGHFICSKCGQVFDVAASRGQPRFQIPPGFKLLSSEISLRGYCPTCARSTAN